MILHCPLLFYELWYISFQLRQRMLLDLIHVNTKLPQVDLCHLNLLHQLLVRRGNIVEREDAPAETE